MHNKQNNIFNKQIESFLRQNGTIENMIKIIAIYNISLDMSVKIMYLSVIF